MATSEEKERILKAIAEGKAYAYLENIELKYRSMIDAYVFPVLVESVPFNEEKMLSLFDNATVYFTPTMTLVSKELKCPNTLRYEYNENCGVRKLSAIRNGKMESLKDLCKSCRYMVEELVGSCSKTKYEPQDGLPHTFDLKQELENYAKIKSGYIRKNEFSREIDFSYDHVAEKIAYYDAKGLWRRNLNKIRKEICSNCVKYKTHTCRKGFSGNGAPGKCHYTKEDLMRRLKKECIADFGSLGRAFWYFSQCGQMMDFKDPNTKRKSARYISVPGNPDGYMDAKGFFMSLTYYPFEIGKYGRRQPSYYWKKEKENEKQYKNYLSENEYKKMFPDKIIKTRYGKKYEELVLTAYATYKHVGATPGQRYYMYSYSNYLVYLGIVNSKIKVGIGASKWNTHIEINDMRDLFDKTHLGITKP